MVRILAQYTQLFKSSEGLHHFYCQPALEPKYMVPFSHFNVRTTRMEYFEAMLRQGFALASSINDRLHHFKQSNISCIKEPKPTHLRLISWRSAEDAIGFRPQLT